VTRKIARGAVRIKHHLDKELRLGNLESKRDWGFAPDYVRGMWMILQQDHPEDFVLATGQTHSVREFTELAFGSVGLDYRDYVVQDPIYMRPADVELLVGNPIKAKQKLGWETQTSFEELVRIMVEAELVGLGKTKDILGAKKSGML
jgi:GDPmannose 4,6-dehydratase